MRDRPADAELCQACHDELKALAVTVLTYSQRYELAKDKRAVFAYMYSRMTDQLADYIAGAGMEFRDPRWVTDLALEFARRFIGAMDGVDAWHTARADVAEAAIYDFVAKPWADVYSAIDGTKSYVFEDMIFSMMAHISYDLPLSVSALHEAGRPGNIVDYHLMNQVLAKNIDDIQDFVAKRYSRLLTSLDTLAGAYDEFLTNYGIRAARAVAWYNCDRLLNPDAHADALGSIERSTQAFIDSVRKPKEWWARLAIRIARLLIPERRVWPKAEPAPGSAW